MSIHRILVEPSTFKITSEIEDENPYMDKIHPIDRKKVNESFIELVSHLNKRHIFEIPKSANVPDIVFIASAGLSLPRLPEPVVILPWMKYKHRRLELPYIRSIFQTLGVRCIEFPGSADAPFEGQPDTKWFHDGKTLVCGYGYRSTRKTFQILESLINQIYAAYDISPPNIHVFKKQHVDFYHLDIGMLEYNQTSVIIHSHLFSQEDKDRLRSILGRKNVHVIRSSDKFCLNAIDCGSHIIGHTMKPSVSAYLHKIIGKPIYEIDMTEFQKSGGSVRCLVFDLFVS